MPIATEAPKTLAEKKKAAEAAYNQIEKDYGKGSVFNMGSKVGVPWPSLSTGIYGVDTTVLGIGGLPRGRIVEVYGPESGGKTTLTLHLIAQAQKAGELCAFIDAENAFDPNWATKIGVNVKELTMSQPDNGEQALEIAETLISSQAFGVVVVDSVAALVPKAELEGDMGDAQMGLQARMMSQAMRKLSGVVASSKTILVFINQVRDKIGVMYGSPETTTGGRALKFYASVRLDVRRISAVKDGDAVVGNRVRVKAAKNKLSPPFREAEVNLMFDKGFDGFTSLVETAVEAGVIEKSGSWFSYKNTRLGQGIEAACATISGNNELNEKIQKELREKTDGGNV
jgi:recombination protein RecA